MRAVAERNVEAILNAAERLLRERREPNISAVAAEARLSRPTVYGHFKDRTTLLEAVVERAVRGAMAEVDKVDLEHGSAREALERLIGAAWNEIGHSVEIADAALAELSADAMRRSHASGRDRVRRLFERGRAAGEFRSDVPTEWLVSACFSLIHTARDDVGAGILDADTARGALLATVRSLVAPAASRSKPASAARRG
jgi:TetR/AcrR family transcriptional regulator, mexCD-oprJ operon repressor